MIIRTMELSDCIPKDKYDTGAAGRAARLGFPALNPILPKLLIWVQDNNWPVAKELFEVFSSAGPEIAPHLNAIFESDDEGWKCSLLNDLVLRLKPEIAELLKPQIIRMATNPTEGETVEQVDILARSMLVQLTGDRA